MPTRPSSISEKYSCALNRSAAEASPTDLSFEQLRANLPVGEVNYVIDRMLEEISILKPNHIATQTQLGDFDQKTMLRQMEL